jgi:t-SNARE complex subunit (syntaxin)
LISNTCPLSRLLIRAGRERSAAESHIQRQPAMSTRDARIQKWAIITLAIVEAVIIAAVLWTRRG